MNIKNIYKCYFISLRCCCFVFVVILNYQQIIKKTNKMMDEMLSGGFGPDLQKCAQESLKELLGENGFDYEKTVDPENPALLKKSRGISRI